jgi:UDP-N-acetylbacillosamine N-acetyltransferase
MEKTDTLAIIGKSGHGKVVADIACANGYVKIMWVDDDAKKEQTISIAQFIRDYTGTPVALGIGDNTARRRIHLQLKQHNIKLQTLIHPSAIVSTSAEIGEGSVVMPLAVINCDAVVQEGVIINTHVTVEHDCVIGAYAHISPNAALAGNVSVGTGTHIGIGASVIQQCRIGDYVVIAAGSAVINDIPDAVMAAGIPAVVKKRTDR